MASFGVIFDADGVLFDSERQSLEALRLAVEKVSGDRVKLASLGLDFVCGRDDDSILDILNRDHGVVVPPARFRDLKLECYRQVVANDPISVASGAVELLDALEAASIPHAIATAAIRAKLDLSLAALGLAHRFPSITSVDEVRAGKPDPALFLLAANRLGQAPHRVIVFEDSVNGIMAANRAGMFSVGVVGTFSREQLSQARQVIENLRQVNVALLRQWVNGHGGLQVSL